MFSFVVLACAVTFAAGSVFQDLPGLKPYRCKGTSEDPRCKGLHKAEHKFHHTDNQGRYTGMHFNLEHHHNLHLLDDHEQVASVVCNADSLVVTRHPHTDHLFRNDVDYNAEDYFVTGSIAHLCPDGMPIRRRIKNVEFRSDLEAHIDTVEAHLAELVKDGDVKFYTNKIVHADEAAAPVDHIAEGNTPHAYGEFQVQEDGSWGTQLTPEYLAEEEELNADDAGRSLLRHHHHHHHHGFGHFTHHISHSVHHFVHHVSHQVHHTVQHVSHQVHHVVHHVGHEITKHVVKPVVHATKKVVKAVVKVVKTIEDWAAKLLTFHKSFHEHKTFGWNYNPHTQSAAKPITFNKGGVIPVQCENCFAEMDFGLDSGFKIKGFKVEQAFVTISGQEHVHMAPNAAIGKTISKSFGPHRILHMPLFHIHFFIGPVPVFIDFDLDIQVGGDLSFHAGAALDSALDDHREVKLGWAYGQIPSDWPLSGVKDTHAKIKKLVWYNVAANTGNLNGHAEIDVSVGIYVQPSITVSVDKILYGSVAVRPEMTSTFTATEDFHGEHTVAENDRALLGGSYTNDIMYDFDITFRMGVTLRAKMSIAGDSLFDKSYTIFDTGVRTVYHKHWSKHSGSGTSVTSRNLLNASPDPQFRSIQDTDIDPEFGVPTLDTIPASSHDNTTLKHLSFKCPRADTCTVAADLVACSALNGKRVCVADQEELLKLDAQVRDHLAEFKNFGPIATARMRAQHCEKVIPICDPVSFEARVTKLCHHQCTDTAEVVGLSQDVGHAMCKDQGTQYYSPFAAPAHAGEGACKLLSQVYDDIATPDHSRCMRAAASDLTHCPNVAGKMVHYDTRHHASIKALDAFIGGIHSSAQKDVHPCPDMAKKLLCSEYMPECVHKNDLDQYYDDHDITERYWDYFDDPYLPEGDFHIVLPMCTATCTNLVESCPGTSDQSFNYCQNQADPFVRARFAPSHQNVCGHKQSEKMVIEDTPAAALPSTATEAGAPPPTKSFAGWEVALLVIASSLVTGLVATGATCAHLRKKKHFVNAAEMVDYTEF